MPMLSFLHLQPTVQKEEKATPTVDRAYTDYTAQEIIDMNAKEQRAFIEQYNLQVDGYKRLTATELEAALLSVLGLETSDAE